MAEMPTPQITPEEMQQVMTELAERSARVAADMATDAPPAEFARNLDDLGITQAFLSLGQKLMADPQRMLETQTRAFQDYLALCQSTMKRFVGDAGEPVKPTPKGDNRFKGDIWQSNFVFDHIRQTYLIAADHIQRTVAETRDLDKQSARKVRFFTRQMIDALAPTNFVMTNPDVLKATLDSGGRNLIDGFRNLMADLERGKGRLAIRMTDTKAFKLGENVASTPGKVVFENDLMQLLQFEPTTKDVDRAPLLIVPPWINKYYILDLRPANSFIKWCTDRGMTVFVISWVNPDEKLAHKTFDDYLLEGPAAALDAIEKATGEDTINLIGYCLGGTLSACFMSWLHARGEQERVKSVTYFTTMLDFEEPGELGVFVDEHSVAQLQKKIEARGFLEGSEMAGTFNLLRDNDLIWSFVVNNYLMGKDPFPFDLLYWNSDATRMPAKMHMRYLRSCYLENQLRVPGAVEVAGEAVDLSSITTPTCFVSTMEDHIAPWKSTYAGARLMGGPVKFILGGSGHIAGIVNPPVPQKYAYWTNDGLAADADAWLASAERRDGSWWPHWGRWIDRFAGGKVPARKPGDRKLKVIENAPGRYASLRLDVQAEGAKGGGEGAKKAAAMPSMPAMTSIPGMADMGKFAVDPVAAFQNLMQMAQTAMQNMQSAGLVPEVDALVPEEVVVPAAEADAPSAKPKVTAAPAPATPRVRATSRRIAASVGVKKAAAPKTAKPKATPKAAKASAVAAAKPAKSGKPVKTDKLPKAAKADKPSKPGKDAKRKKAEAPSTTPAAAKAAPARAKKSAGEAPKAGSSAAAISALFQGQKKK